MATKNSQSGPEEDKPNIEPVSSDEIEKAPSPPKSLEEVHSELEIIRENIQKRKKETAVLKIMFYTGMVILMLGFFYASNTLQRAQLKSLESNFDQLRDRLNTEVLLVDKTLSERITHLEEHFEGANAPNKNIKEALIKMNNSISPLRPSSPKVQELVDQIHKESAEFIDVYEMHKTNQPPKKF